MATLLYRHSFHVLPVLREIPKTRDWSSPLTLCCSMDLNGLFRASCISVYETGNSIEIQTKLNKPPSSPPMLDPKATGKRAEYPRACIRVTMLPDGFAFSTFGLVQPLSRVRLVTMDLPATFGMLVSQYSVESRGSIMNPSVPVSILRFEDQLNMAERELSAFFIAVKTLFGPDQATLSVEDWLDAIEQGLSPNQPRSHDWRAVTIVASSRLAHRLSVAPGNASGADHNSYSGRIKPQVTTDSARSKQNSGVRDSSKIDSSPR